MLIHRGDKIANAGLWAYGIISGTHWYASPLLHPKPPFRYILNSGLTYTFRYRDLEMSSESMTPLTIA